MSTALPAAVVVVGASAGGVEALREFVAELPADLPAAVAIVLHIPPRSPSALGTILDRVGQLPAHQAEPGRRLQAGEIVVGAADHHLMLGKTEIVLGRGPRENGHRPSIDVLFRSAARWWNARAIAVVLSGSQDDGAAGAYSVIESGGTVFVQDPESAAYGGMPRAALAVVPRAPTGTPRELAKLVSDACHGLPAREEQADELLRIETAIAELDEAAHGAVERPGRPAGLACPDCGGAMFELQSGSMLRYRCRVGHAWSPESLLTEHVAAAESALWSAVRTLEEKAALHRRLAEGSTAAAQHSHRQRAEDADASAATNRNLLRDPDAVERAASG